MPSTVAVFPARARSRMSAPERGRRRTRSPRRISAGPMWTQSTRLRSASGPHSLMDALRAGLAADQAVKAQQLFARQRLGPLQEAPGTLLDGCHLALLLVSEGQDPQ